MLEKSMQRLKRTLDSVQVGDYRINQTLRGRIWLRGGNTCILFPMGGRAPELEMESLETEHRVDLRYDKNMRKPFPSAKTSQYHK